MSPEGALTGTANAVHEIQVQLHNHPTSTFGAVCGHGIAGRGGEIRCPAFSWTVRILCAVTITLAMESLKASTVACWKTLLFPGLCISSRYRLVPKRCQRKRA